MVNAKIFAACIHKGRPVEPLFIFEKFGLIYRKRWTFLGGRKELKAHSEPVLREMLDVAER